MTDVVELVANTSYRRTPALSALARYYACEWPSISPASLAVH